MLTLQLNNLRVCIYLSLVICLASCSPYFNQPLQSSRARLGVGAPGNQDLVNLPAPQQKIVAAVYKFRDQTGQYKPSITGANWSTAVTQGATSILLKSLEESGWFTAIERENLSNLLNERKIVRSTRAEAEAITGKPEPILPGLLFAGIILEGGIISYDANIITGGAGLRYFGAGGSSQYREDKVTVYLRAISTSTGEILKTVYTTKTILSQSIDFGVFRYVSFKRLLEAETGFTYNEPSEIAVKEAIDKAVQSMIIEGITAGLWTLKNQQDIESPIFKNYFKEKEELPNTDIHGQLMADRRGRLGIGAAAGGIRYNGDYNRPAIRPMADVGVKLLSRNNLSYEVRLGNGTLATARNFRSTINYAEVNINHYFFPKLQYTPYLQIGGGVAHINNWVGSFSEGFHLNNLYPFIKAGIGLEYMISRRIGVDVNAASSYFLNDRMDGLEQGRFNDYYWTGKVGVNYYFGLFKK